MTKQERNVVIELYGNAHNILLEALEKFPEKMWQWKPGPEKWSIHEVIIHIADSEANSFVRCRRYIAEPGSGVYGYDENKWSKHLDYHSQSIEDSLELFRLLRKMSYDLIKTVDDKTWKTATVHHSENGVVSFEQWLKTYEEHIPVHIRQMQRNLEAWKNK